VYALFAFNLVATDKLSQFKDWEQATALVTTSDASGTAFLVSATKLLTARHVVENLKIGDPVTLVFDRVNANTPIAARLQWKDQTTYTPEQELDYFITDLAVLSIDDPTLVEQIIPLDLGDSEGIGTLTEVVAIGYPNGDFAITEGKINNETYEGRELFKLDAAVNSGNSGGPLISKDEGLVIGMLVGGRRNAAQGENVGNKVNNIRNLLEKHQIVLE
jgi:S1-C subfamily serine protease